MWAIMTRGKMIATEILWRAQISYLHMQLWEEVTTKTLKQLRTT